MRLSKFEFPHKTVDLTKPEQIKAALQREKLNKPSNFAVINNYFFMEEFLREILTGGGDIILSGGNATRAYGDPYRVPTDIDIDIKENDVDLLRSMIFDIIADDHDVEYKIGEPKLHSKKVHKIHIEADLNGFRGEFDIDAVARFPQTVRKGRIRKVISTDEEFDAAVPEAEEILGNKINRLIWMVSRPDVESFPIRDFYDIYKLCEIAAIDRSKINDFLKNKVKESDMVYLDSKRYARDNMPVLISPYMKKKWKKFENQNVIDGEDTLEKITKFTTDLVASMEF
jgi:hypothetical protein